MKSLLIGYDLNRPHQDYSGLISAIKGLFPTYWHNLDSTWIVKTDMSAEAVRDVLIPHIDANDELLVVALVREAAWSLGFKAKAQAWLKQNL